MGMENELSVPSESGRWLLPARRWRHRYTANTFQYPQSRVVGCYLSGAMEMTPETEPFSTLRVGSLVAT